MCTLFSSNDMYVSNRIPLSISTSAVYPQTEHRENQYQSHATISSRSPPSYPQLSTPISSRQVGRAATPRTPNSSAVPKPNWTPLPNLDWLPSVRPDERASRPRMILRSRRWWTVALRPSALLPRVTCGRLPTSSAQRRRRIWK